MRSCNRPQRRFCLKKGKDISIVMSRERRGAKVCERPVEKEMYKAIKVTTNVTSVLCAEEKQKKEDSAGLSISE